MTERREPDISSVGSTWFDWASGRTCKVAPATGAVRWLSEDEFEALYGVKWDPELGQTPEGRDKLRAEKRRADERAEAERRRAEAERRRAGQAEQAAAPGPEDGAAQPADGTGAGHDDAPGPATDAPPAFPADVPEWERRLNGLGDAGKAVFRAAVTAGPLWRTADGGAWVQATDAAVAAGCPDLLATVVAVNLAKLQHTGRLRPVKGGWAVMPSAKLSDESRAVVSARATGDADPEPLPKKDVPVPAKAPKAAPAPEPMADPDPDPVWHRGGVPASVWPPEWGLPAEAGPDPWGRAEEEALDAAERALLLGADARVVSGRLQCRVALGDLGRAMGGDSRQAVSALRSLRSRGRLRNVSENGGDRRSECVTVEEVEPNVPLSGVSLANLSAETRGRERTWHGGRLPQARPAPPEGLLWPKGGERRGVPETVRPASWEEGLSAMDGLSAQARRVMNWALSQAPVRLWRGRPVAALDAHGAAAGCHLSHSDAAEALEALRLAGLTGPAVPFGEMEPRPSLVPLLPASTVTAEESDALAAWVLEGAAPEPAPEPAPDLPEWAPASFDRLLSDMDRTSEAAAEAVRAVCATATPLRWQRGPVVALDRAAMADALGIGPDQVSNKVGYLRRKKALADALGKGGGQRLLPGAKVTEEDKARFLAEAAKAAKARAPKATAHEPDPWLDDAGARAKAPAHRADVSGAPLPAEWEGPLSALERGTVERASMVALLHAARPAMDGGRPLLEASVDEIRAATGLQDPAPVEAALASLEAKGLLGRQKLAGATAWAPFPAAPLSDRSVAALAALASAPAIEEGPRGASGAPGPKPATDAPAPEAKDGAGAPGGTEKMDEPAKAAGAARKEAPVARRKEDPALPEFDGAQLERRAWAARCKALEAAADDESAEAAAALMAAAVEEGSRPAMEAVMAELQAHPRYYRSNPAYASATSAAVTVGALRARARFEEDYAMLLAGAALTLAEDGNLPPLG